MLEVKPLKRKVNTINQGGNFAESEAMPVKPLVTRDDYNVIGRFLVQELRKELVFQKHEATGKLIDSLEYRIKSTTTGISLGIWSEDYGHYVNTGRKAGGKKVPIAVLIEWIKQKGIASGDKEVKGIAFAIQTKIFREGIPTQGSRRIAPRRQNFVDYVINGTEAQIGMLIDKRVQDNIRAQMDKTFADAQRELQKAA